jgi:hypothetical protein
MQRLNVILWTNKLADWSIEINGVRHEHISDENLAELVESAQLLVGDSLAEAAIHRNREPNSRKAI